MSVKQPGRETNYCLINIVSKKPVMFLTVTNTAIAKYNDSTPSTTQLASGDCLSQLDSLPNPTNLPPRSMPHQPLSSFSTIQEDISQKLSRQSSYVRFVSPNLATCYAIIISTKGHEYKSYYHSNIAW
jgi:hypothetical protein